MKKIVALIAVISTFCATITCAFASVDETREVKYECLSREVKEIISMEKFKELPYAMQKSISDNGIDQQIDLASITNSKFVTGYNNFRTYVDVNFSQGTAQSPSLTCVPIAVANILSYFDYRGYSNLIAGSSMSQAEFTQICSDCGWNYNKIALSKGVNGMKTYANRKGYTVTSYFVGSNWNTLKNYIGKNAPVIASDGEHAYTVLGYGNENGKNKVYVQIGIQDAIGMYIWADWSALSGAYAFVIN